jgi:hypothetical protein
VAHTCNPSNQEAEAGSFQVPDQPQLHSETLKERKKERKKEGERERKKKR